MRDHAQHVGVREGIVTHDRTREVVAQHRERLVEERLRERGTRIPQSRIVDPRRIVVRRELHTFVGR